MVKAVTRNVMILAVKATLIEDVKITIIKETGIIISDLVGIKNGVAYVFFTVASYIYHIKQPHIKFFNVNNN